MKIEYMGDLGVTDTYPITAAIICGFLKPIVEAVNMVSALHNSMSAVLTFPRSAVQPPRVTRLKSALPHYRPGNP